MKYTPGPWKISVEKDGDTIIRGGPKGGMVAQVLLSRDEPLIAAAPEMYEALKELTRIIVTTGDIDALNDAVKNALDAINKAEGK